MGKEAQQERVMAEVPLGSKRSFSQQIERSDWKQRLNSHQRLICEFQQFLQPFNLDSCADKLLGRLRFRCFELAGDRASLEKLQVNWQPPDSFNVKIAVRSESGLIFEELTLTGAEIVAWPISTKPLLNTNRLEISLLLPSDEPEIIEFLKEPKVWKMRGDRYPPLVNIHSLYQTDNHEVPWYKYYFVLRLRQQRKPIGFISFVQISQPSLKTPLISPIPFEPVMLSYGLSSSYWGQGLMSEAVSACVPWFVATQRLYELIAFAEINNRASRRILPKLGLQECGLLSNPRISADLKEIYQFIVYKKRYV